MIRILIATTALAALSGLALAQEGSGDLSGKAPILESIPALSKDPAPKVSEFVVGQARLQLLATDFLGVAVYDSAGGPIGKIDDILFDESGKLSVVVLNVSELLGSEKRVAFELAALRHQIVEGEVRLVASIDRPTLESAPGFTSLADEMSLNDGQSLTAEEAEGKPVEVPPAN